MVSDYRIISTPSQGQPSLLPLSSSRLSSCATSQAQILIWSHLLLEQGNKRMQSQQQYGICLDGCLATSSVTSENLFGTSKVLIYHRTSRSSEILPIWEYGHEIVNSHPPVPVATLDLPVVFWQCPGLTPRVSGAELDHVCLPSVATTCQPYRKWRATVSLIGPQDTELDDLVAARSGLHGVQILTASTINTTHLSGSYARIRNSHVSPCMLIIHHRDRCGRAREKQATNPRYSVLSCARFER